MQVFKNPNNQICGMFGFGRSVVKLLLLSLLPLLLAAAAAEVDERCHQAGGR